MRLREYLEKWGACEKGIEDACQYATPQEAWESVRPDYLVWAVTETDLVGDDDKQRFARWCALSVAHLWDMPAVVKEYLETDDESLREAASEAAWAAASEAAWAAADAASCAAARAAAWAAASDAAWAAARAAASVAALAAALAAWDATQEVWEDALVAARTAALSKQAAWIRANIKPNWEVVE